MHTTIDRAGRLVVPKVLRDRLGLTGMEVEVDVVVDGNALRIEPLVGEDLVEENGRLVITSDGGKIDDETVRTLRDADRR